MHEFLSNIFLFANTRAQWYRKLTLLFAILWGRAVKSKTLCKIFALSMLCASPGFSLYNGNPSAPELPEDGYLIPKECWLGLRTGYQGDMVFSRSMTAHASGAEISHQISSFSSYMNSGTFTLDFANRVDLYGVIGSYKLKLSQRLEGDNRVNYSSDHHLAGMMGLRVIAAYWGETHLGVDVKGFLSYPEIDSIELNGSSQPTGSAKFSDREWQIGAGVSHKVSCFVPYIGLTYSHVRLKLSKLNSLAAFYPNKEVRLRNKYSFGFVFGFGLTAETAFAFNVEGRIIEETGATLTADFRF